MEPALLPPRIQRRLLLLLGGTSTKSPTARGAGAAVLSVTALYEVCLLSGKLLSSRSAAWHEYVFKPLMLSNFKEDE